MGMPGQTQSELVDFDVHFVNIKDNNIFFPEILMIIECCDLADWDDFWLTETTFADKMWIKIFSDLRFDRKTEYC